MRWRAVVRACASVTTTSVLVRAQFDIARTCEFDAWTSERARVCAATRPICAPKGALVPPVDVAGWEFGGCFKRMDEVEDVHDARPPPGESVTPATCARACAAIGADAAAIRAVRARAQVSVSHVCACAPLRAFRDVLPSHTAHRCLNQTFACADGSACGALGTFFVYRRRSAPAPSAPHPVRPTPPVSRDGDARAEPELKRVRVREVVAKATALDDACDSLVPVCHVRGVSTQYEHRCQFEHARDGDVDGDDASPGVCARPTNGAGAERAAKSAASGPSRMEMLLRENTQRVQNILDIFSRGDNADEVVASDPSPQPPAPINPCECEDKGGCLVPHRDFDVRFLYLHTEHGGAWWENDALHCVTGMHTLRNASRIACQEACAEDCACTSVVYDADARRCYLVNSLVDRASGKLYERAYDRRSAMVVVSACAYACPLSEGGREVWAKNAPENWSGERTVCDMFVPEGTPAWRVVYTHGHRRVKHFIPCDRGTTHHYAEKPFPEACAAGASTISSAI